MQQLTLDPPCLLMLSLSRQLSVKKYEAEEEFSSTKDNLIVNNWVVLYTIRVVSFESRA